MKKINSLQACERERGGQKTKGVSCHRIIIYQAISCYRWLHNTCVPDIQYTISSCRRTIYSNSFHIYIIIKCLPHALNVLQLFACCFSLFFSLSLLCASVCLFSLCLCFYVDLVHRFPPVIHVDKYYYIKTLCQQTTRQDIHRDGGKWHARMGKIVIAFISVWICACVCAEISVRTSLR